MTENKFGKNIKEHPAKFISSYLNESKNTVYSFQNNTDDLYSVPNFSLNSFGDIDSLETGFTFSNPDYSYNISMEMDIFSDLPKAVFDSTSNKQIATIMKDLKAEYYKRVQKSDRITPKPKLHYLIDEDGVETIQMASTWDQGKALLYFSFEKDSSESSFGLIWNDSKKKNYLSRAGNITLNDMNDIISESIDFIFRVYS